MVEMDGGYRGVQEIACEHAMLRRPFIPFYFYPTVRCAWFQPNDLSFRDVRIDICCKSFPTVLKKLGSSQNPHGHQFFRWHNRRGRSDSP